MPRKNPRAADFASGACAIFKTASLDRCCPHYYLSLSRPNILDSSVAQPADEAESLSDTQSLLERGPVKETQSHASIVLRLLTYG